MFLKGSKLFLVILQVLLIFHPKLSATKASVQNQPEIVDQPITSDKCLHQININVQGVPQEQLDVVELSVKSWQSIFETVNYTKSNCAHSSGDGITDQQEDKATGSDEWWKEKPVIPTNLTDLCLSNNRPNNPSGEVSSTSTSPYSQKSYSNRMQFLTRIKWSPADPMPWVSIDFQQTRKIYYFVMSIRVSYASDTKEFKMFYGDEKKQGWNITGEKLFDIYTGNGFGSWIAKPYNSHYAEGRYFYIIKYPEDAQLDIRDIQCFGI